MRTIHSSRVLSILGALSLVASSASALQSGTPTAADTTSTVTTVSTVSNGDVARTAIGSWGGVYRVQLALAGKEAAPAALVVERAYDALSGFILVDSRGTPLSAIRIDGDVLRARVGTANGTGDLTLRIVGDNVTGTLKVGKQKWDVTGQRTA